MVSKEMATARLREFNPNSGGPQEPLYTREEAVDYARQFVNLNRGSEI